MVPPSNELVAERSGLLQKRRCVPNSSGTYTELWVLVNQSLAAASYACRLMSILLEHDSRLPACSPVQSVWQRVLCFCAVHHLIQSRYQICVAGLSLRSLSPDWMP